MKKLITLIGAVAMAFGLCTAKADSAAIAESIIGFEEGEAGVPSVIPGDFNLTAEDETHGLLWYSAATDTEEITATVKEYADDEALTDENFNYLEIETGDNPLFRTAAAVAVSEEFGVKTLQPVDIAQGVVFDQLVKFSAYESEAEVPTNDVTMKIGIWLKQTEEDDETHDTDGLYVSTAMLDAMMTPTPTNVLVTLPSNVSVTGGWNRLTITAVKAYDITGDSNIVPGFVIAIDGNEVGYSADQDQLFAHGAESEFVTAFAAPLITAKKLFPGRVAYNNGGNTLVGVGMMGSGAVDEISVAKKEFQVTAAEAEGASTADITYNPANGFAASDDLVVITATAKPDYSYKNFEARDGWTKFDDTKITKTVTIAGDDIVIDDVPSAEQVGPGSNVAKAGDTEYATLAEALEADGDVTLLMNVTLTEGLRISKAKAINLAGKTITLSSGQIGITITVDGVIVTNGTIASSLTGNLVGSKAIEVAYASATFKDLTINATNYEYAIYANCDEEAAKDRPTQSEQLMWIYGQQTLKTLDCNKVVINGNGSLFHVEGMEATLNNCSATGSDSDLFANAAHQAAVYSAVNARTTITGSGTYTHVNALQSGNLGGKITVAEGSTATFTGNIKSYMKVGAHTELENVDAYKAEFKFNAGVYTGSIVFEDANARTLDSFTKGATVTIAAPEGYIWFNDTKLGKPIIATFKVDGAVYAAETNIVAFTPQTPTKPTKTGYTFTDWNPTIAEITTDQEYTAQWTANTYTITINLDGAAAPAGWTPGTDSATTNVTFETPSFDLPALTKEDFTFEGYVKDGETETNKTVTIVSTTAAATYTACFTENAPAAITVTVKKGAGIASVSVGGTSLDFDTTTSEATFDVQPDAPTVTLTLTAENTIKIPVYTMSIGNTTTGWFATNKTPVVTADAENQEKNYFTFAAEEASGTDPAITDAAAAQAIKEAAPAVAEKVDALTTGSDAIGGKKLVAWIAAKGGNDPATALDGDYVKASVALDVAPITQSTEIKVAKAATATGNLEFAIKVGEVDVTSIEQIQNFVELCGDLGVEAGWTKLPDSELKSAVKIEEGKLVITPRDDIDKLFLKVVIPPDVTE